MAETIDRVFGGRVTVVQRRDGFRFSLDSLLLARFVELRGGERVVDLGAGNGVVALSLAALNDAVEVVGVELQEAMVARALRGAALNGLEERVRVVACDVRCVERRLASGSFDAAVCNPPYRQRRSGRVSPDPERLLARHEVEGGLADFVRAGAGSASSIRRKGRWSCSRSCAGTGWSPGAPASSIRSPGRPQPWCWPRASRDPARP